MAEKKVVGTAPAVALLIMTIAFLVLPPLAVAAALWSFGLPFAQTLQLALAVWLIGLAAVGLWASHMEERDQRRKVGP